MGEREEKMADDFIEIKTQEEFEERMKSRLEREREVVRKEFDGFMSPEDVKEKYSGYLSEEEVQEKYKGFLSPDEAAAKDKTISEYELASKRVKIAMNSGIPYELANKISGTTEEEMKKDAEVLAGFIKSNQKYPEFKQNRKNEPDEKRAAMKKLLNGMKGE